MLEQSSVKNYTLQLKLPIGKLWTQKLFSIAVITNENGLLHPAHLESLLSIELCPIQNLLRQSIDYRSIVTDSFHLYETMLLLSFDLHIYLSFSCLYNSNYYCYNIMIAVSACTSSTRDNFNYSQMARSCLIVPLLCTLMFSIKTMSVIWMSIIIIILKKKTECFVYPNNPEI